MTPGLLMLWGLAFLVCAGCACGIVLFAAAVVQQIKTNRFEDLKRKQREAFLADPGDTK